MNDDDTTSDHGTGFWICAVVGTALIGWGVYLFLESTSAVGPRVEFAVFVVGSDLANDLLIAPIACLVGVLVARFAPAWLRPPLQAALIATAAVLALAWLPLHHTAAPVGNPSIQPLDYVTATLTVLAVVWGGASVWAWFRWRS